MTAPKPTRANSSLNPTPARRARRHAGRVTLGTAGAALLVVATAAMAGAHVTVHSKDAKPGSKDATLVFKVPNENAKAKTTKIEIDLPSATPLTGVVPQAPTGWSAVTSADKIVFTGGSIGGDDSVEFPIKVAQLPNVHTIVFKALQTYSSGAVVRWIETAAAGGKEPDHPAPTLNLDDPSKLSADEIADAKEDAEKDAKAKKAGGADKDAKAGAADKDAKAGAADKDAKAGAADKDAKAGAADKDAKPTLKVHAGTGGQAAESNTGASPVVPLAMVTLGLGAAGLAGRRLARR
jgi:uncharacterized protein YcnI